MESVIAEQLGKKQVLTFRYFLRASRAGALWAGSIGVEDVTRIQWHKTWDCRVFEHKLQISYVGLLQWKLFYRWSDFSAASGSELAVSSFLSAGYFELLCSIFSCYDIRYVQVTQWLSVHFFFFLVQFCIEEICCVLHVNKDHRSVWHLISVVVEILLLLIV